MRAWSRVVHEEAPISSPTCFARSPTGMMLSTIASHPWRHHDRPGILPSSGAALVILHCIQIVPSTARTVRLTDVGYRDALDLGLGGLSSAFIVLSDLPHSWCRSVCSCSIARWTLSDGRAGRCSWAV